MSLNISTLSNFSSEQHHNSFLKHDRILIKNANLCKIPYKKSLKTRTNTNSTQSDDFHSNVLSDEWIANVKYCHLDNLHSLPYEPIPLNFEDFNLQNLKERIKIIEIRNRKNSIQSSKTLNHTEYENHFDKIDTTLEDSTDKVSLPRYSNKIRYLQSTPSPLKSLEDSKLSKPSKDSIPIRSKTRTDLLPSTKEFKFNDNKLSYSQSNNQTKKDSSKRTTTFPKDETKTNNFNSPTTALSHNVNEYRQVSKVMWSRSIYRVPKRGPLKLSSKELSPEKYKDNIKTIDNPVVNEKDTVSYIPTNLTNTGAKQSTVLQNNLSSIHRKPSIVPSKSSQPKRHLSYPCSQISSISTHPSKLSNEMDENGRTALKLKYINGFDCSNKSSDDEKSVSESKTSSQAKSSVYSRRQENCLVLSDYSSKSCDAEQDLSKLLHEILTFPSLRLIETELNEISI